MAVVFDERSFIETFKRLSPGDRQMLVALATRLARPEGTTGHEAIRLAEKLDFTADELAEIELAVRVFRNVETDEPDGIDLDAQLPV